MYMSVSAAAEKFNLSKQRVKALCEQGKIKGANMLRGVWLIPRNAEKPADFSKKKQFVNTQISLSENGLKNINNHYTLEEVCSLLSISSETAKNWIRLGKLKTEDNGKTFNGKYIQKLCEKMKSGKDGRLKNRRNKKTVTGKSLYKDYIKSGINKELVKHILNQHEFLLEEELRTILAHFAIQLYNQKNEILEDKIAWINRNNMFTEDATFNALILDLLKDVDFSLLDLSKWKEVFYENIHFEPTDDILGFMYISLKDLSHRKQTGTYYTPKKTVNALIAHLLNCTDLQGKTLCDPCCGTGNFFIGLINSGVKAKAIYGQDMDEISVLIARINIYLLDSTITKDALYSHFIVGNTLENTFDLKFSVILGNPPWGYDFSNKEKEYLLKHYDTAKNRGMESYDLFIEKGIDMLEENGYIAYVLPEALLHVASHTQIRRLIVEKTSFKFISYLGNTFSGVQCPAVILGLIKDGNGKTKQCIVSLGKKKFELQKERKIDENSFTFHMNDEEYFCMEAIASIPNAIFLANNAKFALGIVTGNNKKFIKTKKENKDYEIILKGNDILKYSYRNPKNYIKFTPELFQQVAPVEIYRAEEKLLYRFIGKVPVFTYDNNKTLSLNSCNIVIPQIEGMHIKYILAVLNSSVAAFYINKKFHSVKLLRSHIESFPIPVISSEKQENIIKKVDCIINSNKNIYNLYTELDTDIMSLYKLSKNQIETIYNALSDKNLFLAAR